jgi:hypothetical protein
MVMCKFLEPLQHVFITSRSAPMQNSGTLVSWAKQLSIGLCASAGDIEAPGLNHGVPQTIVSKRRVTRAGDAGHV